MKGNVVYLDELRQHDASYVACMACGKDWVAVFPLTAKRLECPECGSMTGDPVQIHNPEWFKRFMRGKNKGHRTMVCLNAQMMERTP